MIERKCFEYTVLYTCKGLVYGKNEKEALGHIYANKKRILEETDDPVVLLDEHYGVVCEDDYLPIGV